MVSEIERLRDDLLRWNNDNEKEQRNQHKEILQVLKEIRDNLKGSKNIDIDMNTQKELNERIQKLEIQLAREKASKETWEQAFRLVAVKGIPVSEEHIKKLGKRKASIESYEEGKKYANHLIELHGIDNEGGEFGAQSGWLVAAANWIREQVVEYAVGLLVDLVKKNAVKAVNYLLEQSEEVIIKGLNRLEEQDRILLINDMKQYPRFAELLKKLGETTQE